MAGEINRVPAGLLSILDMKARGQSPRELSSQVAGIVDLLPLYLQQNRVWRTGFTPAISAPGVFSAVTVPENEFWWVHGVYVQRATVLAAATSYVIGVSYQKTDQLGNLKQVPLTTPGLVFAAGQRAAVAWAGPLLAAPGDAFGAHCWAVGLGTAVGFDCIVDHTPIPI